MRIRRSIPILAAVLLAGLSRPDAVELAPGVELLSGSFVAGRQPDGNTIVLRGTEGLVVVDTGRHVEHTQGIVDFAREAGQDVRVVINTHWHLDHVGGNLALRRAFPAVRVVSSGAIHDALGGFLAGYRKQLETLVAQAETPEAAKPFRDEIGLIDAGRSLAPDEAVTGSGKRAFAGRELEVHLATRAVTAGDVWIYDPSSRILIAGDLVTLPAPLFDTACPDGWGAALERLAAVDFKLLVPGHGAPMSRQAFDRYRRAFQRLLDCAASTADRDACVDVWTEAAGELIPPEDRGLAQSLAGYYVEQVLRGDPARRAALCSAEPEKEKTR